MDTNQNLQTPENDVNDQKEVLISPYGNVIGKPRKKSKPEPKLVRSDRKKRDKDALPPLYGGKSKNSHTYYGTKERIDHNNRVSKATHDQFCWALPVGFKSFFKAAASAEKNAKGNPSDFGPWAFGLVVAEIERKITAGEYTAQQLREMLNVYNADVAVKKEKNGGYSFREDFDILDRVRAELERLSKEEEETPDALLCKR